MKLAGLVLALWALGAASAARYNKDSKAVLADKYVSTADDYLYQATCDNSKFKKACDYSVIVSSPLNVNLSNSTRLFLRIPILSLSKSTVLFLILNRNDRVNMSQIS